MGITLTVAKGFEEKGGWYGREERGEWMCTFSKINCEWGLRKQNGCWGGTLMNITSLDLSVFAGRPVIN